MPENQLKDILYLHEIAQMLADTKIRGLRKKLSKGEAEDLLKIGKLSVYMRPDGIIYTCGNNRDFFFEISTEGKMIGPIVCSFFTNWIPKVEGGEVKYYERVK